MTPLLPIVVCVLLAGGAALTPPAMQAQGNATYRVIVNAANPVSSLTKAQLSQFFLKKVTVWQDGRRVAPADSAEDSTVRQAFSRDVHRRSVAAIKAYWQQRIFSGSDVPAPEFATDAEIVAYVRANPGGIGYVSPDTALAGVKAVGVTP